MKPTDLFIKGAAEEGRKMRIQLPTGQMTEETLTVIGGDSDLFKAELAKSRVAEIELLGQKATMAPEKYAKAEAALKVGLVATLVRGWSFDEPFSHDAVKELFENAPYVLEQVDNFAARRQNFFVPPSMG